MKKRIIYVGTLIDLAEMFEPGVEAESIEVTNMQRTYADFHGLGVEAESIEVTNADFHGLGVEAESIEVTNMIKYSNHE